MNFNGLSDCTIYVSSKSHQFHSALPTAVLDDAQKQNE